MIPKNSLKHRKYNIGDLVSICVTNKPMSPKIAYRDLSKSDFISSKRDDREVATELSNEIAIGVILDDAFDSNFSWYRVLVGKTRYWVYQGHMNPLSKNQD